MNLSVFTPVFFDVKTKKKDPRISQIDTISIIRPGEPLFKFERSQYGEEGIIRQFMDELDGDDILLVGYWSKSLDLPFLSARMAKLGVLANRIGCLYSIPHLDMVEIIQTYASPFQTPINWNELGLEGSKVEITKEAFLLYRDLCRFHLRNASPLLNESVRFEGMEAER